MTRPGLNHYAYPLGLQKGRVAARVFFAVLATAPDTFLPGKNKKQH